MLDYKERRVPVAAIEKCSTKKDYKERRVPVAALEKCSTKKEGS